MFDLDAKNSAVDGAVRVTTQTSTSTKISDCQPGCEMESREYRGGQVVVKDIYQDAYWIDPLEEKAVRSDVVRFRARDEDGFGFDANGARLRGTLPTVIHDPTSAESWELSVSYQPSGSYVWDSTSKPISNLGIGIWRMPAKQALDGTYVQAVDDEALANDTTKALWCGLFGGLAGGALVGAVQELMQTRRLGRFLNPNSEAGRSERGT
jgi:hypothetical protein